jgi:hypothetical protein
MTLLPCSHSAIKSRASKGISKKIKEQATDSARKQKNSDINIYDRVDLKKTFSSLYKYIQILYRAYKLYFYIMFLT